MDRINEIVTTLQLVDPLLLWCGYLAAMCVGLYLIVITHPRVKPP